VSIAPKSKGNSVDLLLEAGLDRDSFFCAVIAFFFWRNVKY